MKSTSVYFMAVLSLSVSAFPPVSTTVYAASDSCDPVQNEIQRAVKRSEERIAEYIEGLEDFTSEKQRYGFAIAVGACGKLVWNAEYGFADLENNVPVSQDTKFRIGSVSKTLTSAALGQLADSGQLDWDAEIQTYVPSFPRKDYPITVRQVAGHLSGIRHYISNAEGESDINYQSVEETLKLFANDPLLFEPGTNYEYSSYGWNLLSAVIEKISGVSFLNYMSTHIFDAAGMKNTVPGIRNAIIPNRSDFYQFDTAGKINRNAPNADLSNTWAGGGFLSTPSDLVRFAHAMFNGTLVKRDTFNLLTTGQSVSSGEATNYGIGWDTDLTDREVGRASRSFSEETMHSTADILKDHRVVGHAGGHVGGLTLFLAAPDSTEAIVVAATSNNGNYAFYPSFALPVLAEFIRETE